MNKYYIWWIATIVSGALLGTFAPEELKYGVGFVVGTISLMWLQIAKDKNRGDKNGYA
jgi:predicted branched-subunit amino acid permease